MPCEDLLAQRALQEALDSTGQRGIGGRDSLTSAGTGDGCAAEVLNEADVTHLARSVSTHRRDPSLTISTVPCSSVR